MPGTVPIPTPILRFIHIDNLDTTLKRKGMYAPNHIPKDGLPWRDFHNTDVQTSRGKKIVPCGPGGPILDYVPFYLGWHSPMLLNLKTGRVAGYNGGQEPFIYFASTAQKVQDSGSRFVFTDGHGLHALTDFYDNLTDLDKVDWIMVREKYWTDKVEDNDRKRRKQAEFMVHRFFDLSFIDEIVVINDSMKSRVEAIVARHPKCGCGTVVNVKRAWYY